ncbi:MAG: glycosyltransferase family 39 protein [Gemmatimonadota bacterium]|nr:glycosyltransferase family 39 protein [Gemmatimonadota bacterium]
MLASLLSLLLVLVCVLLAKQSRGADVAAVERLERLGSLRYVPLALATINALLVWWMLGFELSPVPQIQDEAAYLLQAGIFARGRWTEMARPLPEFFAQMHVFTTPVLASKYPPGTSLFLTPFVWIGFPALAPMVLAGFTGAFIFVLARRVGNATIAALAWVIWTTAPWALRWQATFLSQTVTVTLWLAALYFLLKYRDEQRPWSLIALAATVGCCAITRPVTAVALAVPVGVVVMRDFWRTRAWRSLTAAALTGAVIVGILPLQNWMTTGDWRVSPLVNYSREYLPSDFPGFGFDSSQPVAPLPSDLERSRQELFEARRQHTLEALPQTLVHRWARSLTIVAYGWRVGLAPLILLGALVMPAAGILAFGMSIGLLVAYAFHSHWPQWSQYYLEAAPGYAFALAAGIWGLASWVIRGWPTVRRRTLWDGAEPRVAVAAVVTTVALGIPGLLRIPTTVSRYQSEVAYQRRFGQALRLVRKEPHKTIVFVDYGPNHNAHFSLVRNVPNLTDARTWIVYERGRDDLRLMRLAPERRAYIYHADDGRLTRLPPLAELERIVAAR